MCKDCGYEPYLAGRVIVVQLPIPDQRVEEEIEYPDGHEYAGLGYTKARWVPAWDRPRGYTLRCASHHNGWVKGRTASGKQISRRVEDVMAYSVE